MPMQRLRAEFDVAVTEMLPPWREWTNGCDSRVRIQYGSTLWNVDGATHTGKRRLFTSTFRKRGFHQESLASDPRGRGSVPIEARS